MDVLMPLENTSANYRVSASPAQTKERSSAPVAEAPEADHHERVVLLASAFNTCANPSTPHLHKLARRLRMAPEEVEDWFSRRRDFEAWVRSQSFNSAAEVTAALERYQQQQQQQQQ